MRQVIVFTYTLFEILIKDFRALIRQNLPFINATLAWKPIIIESYRGHCNYRRENKTFTWA